MHYTIVNLFLISTATDYLFYMQIPEKFDKRKFCEESWHLALCESNERQLCSDIVKIQYIPEQNNTLLTKK